MFYPMRFEGWLFVAIPPFKYLIFKVFVSKTPNKINYGSTPALSVPLFKKKTD